MKRISKLSDGQVWYRDQYLSTPHWKAKRKAFFAHPKNKHCRVCQTPYNLVPHHLSYQNMYKEDIRRDLVALCDRCHTRVHFKRHNGEKVALTRKTMYARIRFLTYTYPFRAFRLGSFIDSLF